MEYIKVILLVCNIGLTFEIINSGYINEKIINQNEENTNMPDEDKNKTIIQFATNVYPTHYKVQLAVDTKLSYPNISLSGQVDIDITIDTIFEYYSDNMIQTLLLHAKNIELNNFQTTLHNKTAIFFVKKSFTIQKEFIAIEFKELVPPGNYILTIVFHSTVNDSFIRYMLSPEHQMFGLKNDLIMTHFEHAARQLFPCWDDPEYKTTFDIEVTHENEYTVLSNVPVLKIDDADAEVLIDDPNMKCTKFVTTPKMSTHQLVILLQPYNIFTDPTETVHTWRKSDKTSIISFIHNTINNISKYLQEYTATSLNDQKIDYVVIPNAPYSKAQLGLIIYRESDVIYDETKDPVDVKNNVKDIIEYQVAHRWFGGLIMPEFWSDSWLAESFALYFSYYFPRMKIDSHNDYVKLWKNVVENKIVQLRIIENYNDVLRMDNGTLPPVFSEPLSLSGSPLAVYHKGALILRMINNMFPEKKFQEFIKDYLNKYKNGLVTSYDFFSMLKDVKYSKRFTYFDPTFPNVMQAYIEEKGYPIITVKIDRENNTVTLFQTSSVLEYFDYSDDRKIWDLRWWIPVTYMVKDNIPSHTYNFHWVEPTRHYLLPLDTPYFTNKDSWILLNVGLTGYYHVRYERDNWENLGHFLKSKNYSGIPVLNRAQLIIDICVEYRNHRTDWKLFELITSYLSQETDYIPWIAMFKCLDMLEDFFKLPQSKQYQMHIANYFTSILNEIGYEEDPNDDDIKKIVRQKLAFYACALGNPTCRSAAADKLNKYFANRTIHKILPWWQEWTFCFGVTHGDPSRIWDKMYQLLYKEITNKTILNYLTCVEDVSVLYNFLVFIGNEYYFICAEEADRTDLFNTMIKKHINNDIFFSFIMEDASLVKPVFTSDVFDTIISNIYYNSKLDWINERIMSTTHYPLNYKIIQQQEKIAVLQYKIDMMFPENDS